METAVLRSKSKPDLLLLLNLARKIGVETAILTSDEIEEIGLGLAIQRGRTGEFVNDKSFLSHLKKRAK